MTITINEEELEQQVKEEMLRRICRDIEDSISNASEDGRYLRHLYKKELGEAIRKIFREQPNLVDDAVERASKYLYEKGKAVLVNGKESSNGHAD